MAQPNWFIDVMMFRIAFLYEYGTYREMLLYATKVWNWIDRHSDRHYLWQTMAENWPELFEDRTDVNSFRFTYVGPMDRIVKKALAP